MAKVYRLPSINGASRFYTSKREASRAFNTDDEPEMIEVHDAAELCEQLEREADEQERESLAALYHLKELISVASTESLETIEGKRALAFVRARDPKFLEACRL